MDNEIKELVYIAISAIILSLVLSFASYGMQINRELAEIRNTQLLGAKQVKQYNEYNNYSRNTVIGDEVIQCIRLYYDKGIDIFVDSRTNTAMNPDKTIDADSNTSCDDCVRVDTKDGEVLLYDHRVFNLAQFYAHLDGYNYFKVHQTNTDRPEEDMRNWFPTDARYRAYLVYNSEDIIPLYERIIDKYDITSGSDNIEKLDSCVSQPPANSEVTGIIFINIDELD